MYINDLLKEKNISKYRLAKESGIPQTTIMDICSGKAHIEKCSADTIYRIAKVLGVSMESLIEEKMNPDFENHKRVSFDVYKSNVCHYVKDKGDIDFIIETLSKDEIRALYDRQWYAESFYLLAMVDYLSKENEYEINIKEDDEAYKLLDLLIQNKVKVEKFEIKKPSLHDIFIEKVGE